MTGYAFHIHPITDEDVLLFLKLCYYPERSLYINRTLPGPEH